MKIAVITTETPHHAHFVRELANEFPLEGVLVEQTSPKTPFETRHSFEDLRDDYEREVFFGGRDFAVRDAAKIFEVSSTNDPQAVSKLKKMRPDIVVVFGAGKLRREVIEVCPNGIINLHGGDPEEYRGLDSHLWAIYHQDFDSLVTTLHRVNEELDDGDIILQTRVPLKRGMLIHEIRRYNTEACVELVWSALHTYLRHYRFISRPQRKQGRYYSFMPSALKEICRMRFERYARGLNGSC